MPRRSKGEGSVTRRKDGRWQASLLAGYKPDGKPLRRYFYADTPTEARALLRDAIRRGEDRSGAPALTPARLTVAAFLEEWLNDAARHRLKRSTFEQYVSVTRRTLTPALGRHRLDKLTPAHVQHMTASMLGRGLAPSTARFARSILVSALADAVKWGMVDRNAAALSNGPRMERHEMSAWTQEEARAFLDAVRGGAWEALYITALSTGLRRGELLALLWGDVDLDKSTLKVSGTLQRLQGGIVRTAPKSKSGVREIHLGANTVQALRAHQARQRWQARTAPEWHATGYVFTAANGKPIEPRNLLRDFKAGVLRAGVRPIRFHDLRHTFAALMLAGGASLFAVSRILGHASINITADVYGHLYDEERKRAASLIDDALGL
jgi:integrase